MGRDVTHPGVNSLPIPPWTFPIQEFVVFTQYRVNHVTVQVGGSLTVFIVVLPASIVCKTWSEFWPLLGFWFHSVFAVQGFEIFPIVRADYWDHFLPIMLWFFWGIVIFCNCRAFGDQTIVWTANFHRWKFRYRRFKRGLVHPVLAADPRADYREIWRGLNVWWRFLLCSGDDPGSIDGGLESWFGCRMYWIVIEVSGQKWHLLAWLELAAMLTRPVPPREIYLGGLVTWDFHLNYFTVCDD